MAFILIQHLDPTHRSLLSELLAPITTMPVVDAQHGTRVRANTVYVIQPDTALAIRDGAIELTSPTLHRGVRLPVDHLFRSLAAEFGLRAVGVVLSGAGSDGSAGVREIRRAGGLTIAQEPSEAGQTGMPQSAVDTGAIDLTLRISEIPSALVRFDQIPASERLDTVPDSDEDGVDDDLPGPTRPLVLDSQSFARLAATLEANSDFNLRVYKSGTVQRRVSRRMMLAGYDSLESYLALLRRDPGERKAVIRDLFETVSKPWRLFQKLGVSRPLQAAFAHASNNAEEVPMSGVSDDVAARPFRRTDVALEVLRRSVMQVHVPPSIVVSESGAILLMHGELRPYLRFPDGEPRFDLGSMVDSDLATRTRAAMYKCRRDHVPIEAFSSPDGGKRRVRIRAHPGIGLPEGAVIVSFETLSDVVAVSTVDVLVSTADDAVIDELERELSATREDLRSTVEELESSNEEHRSANEESMSMNEELQSANEELEATTEELRSLNEELTTVNMQLREKIHQVEQMNDDTTNFFASTKIATLFLDEQLCVKRFTPAGEALLRFDHADEGRFVGDIARELLQDGLVDAAQRVLESLVSESAEVPFETDRWLARRVLPYRTEGRRIEGVVITFTDISELKAATENLAMRERQQALIARLGARALEAEDLQVFLDEAVRAVQQALGVDLCKILELQPGGLMLLRASIGFDEGLNRNATVPSSSGSQAGYTLQVQETVVVDDLATEQRFHGPPLLIDHGVVSGMSCVIRNGDELYGVLGVHTRYPRHFVAQEQRLIGSVASMIGLAVVRLNARMRLAFEAGAARALNDARTIEQFVTNIHATATQELGSRLTELWQLDGNGTLTRTFVLASAGFDENSSWSIDESARLEGRATAQWITNLHPEERSGGTGAGLAQGMRSGVAFAVVAGAEFLGVVVLLSDQHLYADTPMLRGLEPIGRATGTVLRRLDAEHRYQLTVDQAPIGIADRAPNGQLLRVNDRFCEIIGYTREEILTGQWPQLAGLAPMLRDGRPTAVDAMDESAAALSTFEQEFVRNDGTEVVVELSTRTVSQPSGAPAYTVLVVEDVTQRKAIEANLIRSESRFRDALMYSPSPKMLFDSNGTVLFLSNSWTEATGYGIENIPTVREWRLASYRVADEGERLAESFFQELPQQLLREREVVTKAGSVRIMTFSVVRLTPMTQGEELFLVAASDVTQEREFERQLKQESEQKDTFISMLGHELRNPLAAVSNATALLNRLNNADPNIARVTGVLFRQTGHMVRLLDGLLDVSRLSHGMIALKRARVNLSQLVDHVVSDARARLESRASDITLDDAGEDVWIEGDEVRLTQILENLLTNGLKFSAEGDAVDVIVRVDAQWAVVTVRDNGVGIDSEFLPDLFAPFRQGRDARRRADGGLGLGLALVKMLTDLHGGSVSAASAGVGHGASFRIMLPFERGESATRAPTIDATAAAEAGARTILVVDDNTDAADSLRDLLALDGHTIHVANTALEAIAMMARLHPDVVFCDIGLPGGLSGFDVLRAAREDTTNTATIVALSGYGATTDAEACLRAGFDAHLTKPASLSDLRSHL